MNDATARATPMPISSPRDGALRPPLPRNTAPAVGRVKERLHHLFVLVCAIAFAAPAWAAGWTFADLPLSSDAQALTLGHQAALFPTGPGTAKNGLVRLPDVLMNPGAASVQTTFLKKLSDSEEIQTVVLKTGENVTMVHAGWESKQMAIRLVSKQALAGATDLQKAAAALTLMDRAGLFDNPWPWRDAAEVFSHPPKPDQDGYPLSTPVDFMTPHVQVIRAGTLPNAGGSYVEISFFQGL